MNIRGIPVIPYEPYMGWYNSKQVYELRKRIIAVNSYEEQMRNICVRLSSHYKDGSLQCQNIHTLFQIIFDEKNCIFANLLLISMERLLV